MSDALGFAPDAAIGCRDFKIGCIGAGFIMADVHLAAYAEAGFPVVAIASRTPAKAAEVAEALGHRACPRDARAADRGPRGRDRRHRLPARPAARPDPPRAEAAARQGDPGAEAPGARPGRGEADRAGVPDCRQGAVGQPEHALRPVDARAQAAARPGRSGRAGDRHDRDARDPALAGFPARLRPADPAQHEHPSSRRAALPVRRPDRDLHRRTHRPAHRFRAHRRHHRLDAPVPLRPDRRVARGCLVGAARVEGFQSDIYIKWRVEGTEGVAQGTIGWPDYPSGSPSTLRYCSLRATGGAWVEPTLGHDVVPARLQGRDGAAPGRAARGQGAHAQRRATMSRRWRWSRPATARCKEGRSVKLAELGY